MSFPEQAVFFSARDEAKSSHSTLHTSHSTLHTSQSALHTSHFSLLPSHSKPHTSHCALRTPNLNFTLHTSHFTFHTSHFSLPTASFTLHTALFTPHTSHCSKPTCNKKTLVPKWRKNANKSISQPSCSHSNTIYEIQLQKTIVLRMQPRHEATLTQPLQCDLQRRNGVGNCSSKTGFRRQSEKKTILKHFLKGFLEAKSLAPKWRKSANKSLSQPSCSHSNTIYEVQLQKTIVLRMQPKQEATLTQPLQCDLQRLSGKPQSHLHCGNDPTVAKQNGIPSATHPPATLAIPFTLRERSYSCKSQWNSIGNSSTSTTCNPIYIAGTILQLQSTMEFCRPHMHEKQVKPHLQCGTDPSMIRPWSDHTRDRLATVAPQR